MNFMNGDSDRERSLEILARMTEPAGQTHDDTWFKKVLLPTIGRYVEAQVRPLRERIAALEATGIKYCGTYQRSCEYQRGDVVTASGSMWVATCDTPPQEVPGKSVCWQLSVKSR
jgi:hypothetical protein